MIEPAAATADRAFVSSAATALHGRPPLGLVGAARRGLELLLAVGLPLALGGRLAWDFAGGFHTFDFHTFWVAGHDVLHGRSPYPDALPHAAHRDTFRPFVYPAPAAVAMTPLALLPLAVADVVFAAAGVAAFVLALRLVGVRDARCYGAAFASLPVFGAIGNGAITPWLVLGTAALWRYRDRALAAGAVLAALVAAKLFLWPLALWLLATRRLRAAAASVAIAAAGTAGAWALIGFAGLRTYGDLLDRLTALVGPQSYSPYALALSLGASASAARAAVLAAGIALVAGMAWAVRRADGEGRDGERRAFTLALAAALAVTPVVWPHYLALLFVPIALLRPRLSGVWYALLPLWLVSGAWSYGDPSVIAPVLAIAAAVLAYVAVARKSSTAPLSA